MGAPKLERPLAKGRLCLVAAAAGLATMSYGAVYASARAGPSATQKFEPAPAWEWSCAMDGGGGNCGLVASVASVLLTDLVKAELLPSDAVLTKYGEG